MTLKNDFANGDTYTATHANDVATQVNTNTTDIAGKAAASGGTLTNPRISAIKDSNGNTVLDLPSAASAVNYVAIHNNSTGNLPYIQATGSDTNVPLYMVPQGNSPIYFADSSFATILLLSPGAGSPVNYLNVTNGATGTGPQVAANGADTDVNVNFVPKGAGRLQEAGNALFNTARAIPAANIPNGLTNGNTSRQSQLVVSATSYYIAGSNLNLPATLKGGMAVGTRFRWRVAMDKTNAGTGAFAIEIRRGTNGTTADTADVSQSIGTQTAVVDSMVVDVEMVVTTTGATGAYYWSIIPVNKAITATGFGVATGTTGYFSGTVSSVAMNTASLIFGLSFKATTGTPTITIPMVQASAINIS